MPYLTPRTEVTQLDNTGSGTVRFAIDSTNQRWIIDMVAVSTDQAATGPVPVCLCYLGSTFVGGTRQGNMDTAQGRVVLYPDGVLSVVWSGGIPGSTATASITGTFDPAGIPLR